MKNCSIFKHFWKIVLLSKSSVDKSFTFKLLYEEEFYLQTPLRRRVRPSNCFAEKISIFKLFCGEKFDLQTLLWKRFRPSTFLWRSVWPSILLWKRVWVSISSMKTSLRSELFYGDKFESQSLLWRRVSNSSMKKSFKFFYE